MYVYGPLDETLVLKNSAAMADRVLKNMRVKTRDDYVITPSEVVRSAKSFNHNHNKIVKSGWLSTALISALIGQFNRTVRAITNAL